GSRFYFLTGIGARLELALLNADLLPVHREVRLSVRDRIDHVVGRIGIECKVAGDPDSVRRQMERYADHDRIEALVLVTTRSRHAELQGYVLSARGRAVPVAVVYLGGQAL
ncbi:MAG: hypothetical protein ITG02_01055, partial [Patulibacter sp.]|nr:hypothetical protein [Patulibacter sp.]